MEKGERSHGICKLQMLCNVWCLLATWMCLCNDDDYHHLVDVMDRLVQGTLGTFLFFPRTYSWYTLLFSPFFMQAVCGPVEVLPQLICGERGD
ncbi:hypothetical protein B0T13DRAFT_480473 [Neurospora crassa]|nr:hypothetical protein B0T13DRAFT_480473 [Neurospora crassa]